MKRRFITLFILVLNLAGGCALTNKNYQKAEEHYQEARICMKKRDADCIVSNLEKAIELGFLDKDRSPGSIYGMLAAGYQIKNDTNNAIKYYKLAIEEFEKKRTYWLNKGDEKMAASTEETIERTRKQLESVKKNRGSAR